MRAGPGPGGKPQRDARKARARHATHGADEEAQEHPDSYGLLAPEPTAHVDPRDQGRYVDPRDQGRYVDPRDQGRYVDPRDQGRYVDPRDQGPYVDPRDPATFVARRSAVPPPVPPAPMPVVPPPAPVAGPPHTPVRSFFEDQGAQFSPYDASGPMTQAIPTGLRYGADPAAPAPAGPAAPAGPDPLAAGRAAPDYGQETARALRPAPETPRSLPRRRDLRGPREDAPFGDPLPPTGQSALPPTGPQFPPTGPQFPPVQPQQIGGSFSPRPGLNIRPAEALLRRPQNALPVVAPGVPPQFPPASVGPAAPQSPAPFQAPRAYRPQQPYEGPPQVASRAFETPPAGAAPYQPTAYVSGSLPQTRRRQPADDGPPSVLLPRVSAEPGLLPGGYPYVDSPAYEVRRGGQRSRTALADLDDDLLAPRRSDRRFDEDSSRGRPPKKKSAVGAVVEVVVVVALALVLAVVVKTFLVQAFFIPSESMQTTLLIGDRVLVSKLTPGPFALKHGDIIVFKDPDHWLPPSAPPDDGQVQAAVRRALTLVRLLPQDSDEHLIKRIIGLPGDTVECCDAQGRVIVNGVPVDEPYLRAGVKPSEKSFKITVPEGRLWVMGDNRPESADSRFHPDAAGGGTVPVSDVVGRAFVIVWPFSSARGLGIPDQVFADVPAEPGGS